MNGKEALENLWGDFIPDDIIEPENPKHTKTENQINFPNQAIETPKVKSNITLPPLKHTGSSNVLTLEEKHFIHSQIFLKNEPFSAGIQKPFYTSLLPHFNTTSLISDGIRSAPTAARFEGFSDFTSKNPLQMNGHNIGNTHRSLPTCRMAKDTFGNIFM